MNKKKARKVYFTDEEWQYLGQYVFAKGAGSISSWLSMQAEAAIARNPLTKAQAIKVQIAYGIDTCELINRLALVLKQSRP